MNCPKCQTACATADKFCPSCGSRLPEEEPAGGTCPACGGSVEPDEHFCSHCGHELADSRPVTEPEPALSPELDLEPEPEADPESVSPAPAPAEELPSAPDPEPESEPPPAPAPADVVSKPVAAGKPIPLLLLFLGGAAVVLFVLVAYLGSRLLGSGDEPASPPGSPPAGGLPLAVTSLAYAADDRALAAGQNDGAVRFWTADLSGPFQQSIEAGESPVLAVALPVTGRKAATLSAGSDRIALYDFAAGKVGASVPLRAPVDAAFTKVACLGVSTNGATLAIFDPAARVVRLVEIATKQERASYPVPDRVGLTAASLSGSLRFLVFGSDDGGVGLFDLIGQTSVGGEPERHGGPVRAVAVSPTGRLLASVGSAPTEATAIRLYDPIDGKVVRTFRAPNPARALAFSHDGKHLAAGGEGFLAVWEVASGSPYARASLEKED